MISISVITVCYNAQNTIGKTIESILSQSYENIEFILVDGASTDNTLNVAKEYLAKKVKIKTYVLSEPDKGIYNAMNKGVTLSSGNYCVFMNAGDTFYAKDTIKNAVQEFENENYDILVGKSFNQHGIQSPLNKSCLSLFMIYKYGFCHQAAFIKRNLLIKYPYDECFRIASDSKFFLEVLIQNKATYKDIQTIVCNYAPGGISSNKTLHDDELNTCIYQLFGERIATDILLLDKFYNPLLRALLPLSESRLFKSFIFPVTKKVFHVIISSRI